MGDRLNLPVVDAVKAGAQSLRVFGRVFFPATFRQESPPMHDELGAALDSDAREIAVKMFRGSAKTATLRVFCARRISYGQSRTILVVSEAQGHSVRTVRWLKRQVEYNKYWAQTFGLERGDLWTNEQIQIKHKVLGVTITIVALGITGQTRGVNIDDFRPDLIVVDDPCDEENVKTKEQRQKIVDLFFGALHKSLAPPSEAPKAKIVLLQTPLHRDDLIAQVFKDESWLRLEFGCFNAKGESNWPSRFPTKFLLEEKAKHQQRNQLALWMREMEVKIIATELASFRGEWLKKWTVLPVGMRVIIALDPASADEETAKEKDTDFNAMVAMGQRGQDIFILEYFLAKGKEPDELAAKFFEMVLRWHATELVTESIGFQRHLAWYFRQEMKKRRIFLPIHEIKGERRAKADRILQAFTVSGVAPYGHLHIREGMVEFQSDFETWGPTVGIHDDLLDATANGIRRLLGFLDDYIEGEATEVDDEDDVDYHERRLIGDRPANMGCP